MNCYLIKIYVCQKMSFISRCPESLLPVLGLQRQHCHHALPHLHVALLLRPDFRRYLGRLLPGHVQDNLLRERRLRHRRARPDPRSNRRHLQRQPGHPRHACRVSLSHFCYSLLIYKVGHTNCVFNPLCPINALARLFHLSRQSKIAL